MECKRHADADVAVNDSFGKSMGKSGGSATASEIRGSGKKKLPLQPSEDPDYRR